MDGTITGAVFYDYIALVGSKQSIVSRLVHIVLFIAQKKQQECNLEVDWSPGSLLFFANAGAN